MAEPILGGPASVVETACPLDCPDACSLSVTVQHGKVITIDGSRKNPITGAVVAADIVLNVEPSRETELAALKTEIFDQCRSNLARHKVPAAIRFVPALEVAASGKLSRGQI